MKNNIAQKISIDHFRYYRCWNSNLVNNNPGVNIQTLTNKFIAVNTFNIQDAYFAFYNRLTHFSREALEDCLYNQKNLVRFKGMRTGIYIIPGSDIEFFYAATFEQREKNSGKTLNNYKIKKSELSEISRYIISSIKIEGKTKRQLTKFAPEWSLKKVENENASSLIKSNILDQVLNVLFERWQIVPGKDKWDSIGKKFCLFDELHNKKSFTKDRVEAEKDMVIRYLQSYGPVTSEDIAWWCGFTISKVQKILESFKDEISSIEVDFNDNEYLIWSTKLNLFTKKDFKLHDQYFLVGKNDPFVLGYKDMSPMLSSTLLENVFNRYGESEAVILINGEIVGTWTYESGKKSTIIKINYFSKINVRMEDKISREIDKMGDFLAGEEMEISVEISYI